MPDILVLGPGCSKCQMLYERTKQAAQELGLTCEVFKVTEINAIVGFGVMSTPALIVDGTIKVQGRVPTLAQLKEMLS